MKWYESFNEQYRECKKNGNSFIVEDPFFNHQIIVCVQFKTYCNSKACLETRIKKGEKLNERIYNCNTTI